MKKTYFQPFADVTLMSACDLLTESVEGDTGKREDCYSLFGNKF